MRNAAQSALIIATYFVAGFIDSHASARGEAISVVFVVGRDRNRGEIVSTVIQTEFCPTSYAVHVNIRDLADDINRRFSAFNRIKLFFTESNVQSAMLHHPLSLPNCSHLLDLRDRRELIRQRKEIYANFSFETNGMSWSFSGVLKKQFRFYNLTNSIACNSSGVSEYISTRFSHLGVCLNCGYSCGGGGLLRFITYQPQLPPEQADLNPRSGEQRGGKNSKPASIGGQPPIEPRLLVGFIFLLCSLGFGFFAGENFYRERDVIGAALIVCGAGCVAIGFFLIWSWQFPWSWDWLI